MPADRQQIDPPRRHVHGILPTACAASVWNSAPAVLAIAASAGMSWITPISLFTAMTLTSSVGTVSAVAQHVGIEQAVRRDRQEHRLEPLAGQVGDRFQDAFVLGRDGDDAPSRVAMPGRMAGGALDGDVVALGGARGEHDLLRSAPIRRRPGARAASTAASAPRPITCSTLCGLPYCSEKNGSMAATTRGSQRVVAWLSR